MRPDQTIIRPTPGGRKPNQTQQTPVDTQQHHQVEPDAFQTQQVQASQPNVQQAGAPPISVAKASSNVMLAAAGNIFSLLKAISNIPSPPSDVTVIRKQFLQLFNQFETQLKSSGIDQDSVVYARYALCCTVDEIVLNTPWGGRSMWSTSSLLSTFHREATGGEHFFKILERCLQQVDSNRDLLELIYVCLNFGFKGKFRIEHQGDEKHHMLIEQVYQALYHGSPLVQAPLSPNWQGVDTQKRKLSWELPIWVVLSLAACAILSVYLYLQHDLHKLRTPTLVQLENLLNSTPVAQQTTPPPEVVDTPLTQPDLNQLFKDEIAQGIIGITTIDQDAKITLWNAFPSAAAKTKQDFLPVIQKIAYVLSSRPGDIIVTGYTDSIPMSTEQYPSNWHLSLARAQAVSSLLDQYSALGERITTQGQGDKYPLSDNSTKEGRAKNRRVEVVLLGEIN